MKDNNKAILIKANAAVTAGDYEGFLSFCSEDTVWTFVGDETLVGKEAVRAYMAKAYVKPPVFQVDTFISEDDFVTAVGKISLMNKGGEMESFDYCDVWQFRDGKLFKLNAFVIASK
ncbi:nuclear transport factor 2 family protein [Sphingobacterium sp. MYb382]|uniref:nuclear transport factor 2 family protein n=1 Tax=Sphingobacterium sp. MYb382 TaxID=2745278 RepID=UPI00309EF7B5